MKYNLDDRTENGQRKRIMLWGAGEKTREFLSYHEFYDDIIEIAAIADADEKKWGKSLEGYQIIPPKEAYGMDYERFIVPSEQYFEEIAERILSDTGMEKSGIEHVTYITKCKLAVRYAKHADKADLLSYIRNHPLGAFNYPFVEKYTGVCPEIGYDGEAGLFFVIHKGRRMYMARWFRTEEMVLAYYRNLLMEQDEHSPHRYLQGEFEVKQGDVVVDAGAAEGIFTLEVIERAKKVYVIETNREWVEALSYTFRDYREKIEIINRFVSDYTAYRTAALDDLIQDDVDFLKMDVEGCEYAAMAGAEKLIKSTSHIRCALCAYHSDHDGLALKVLAERFGLRTSFSEGYMLFPYSIQQTYIMPTFRRGLLRCEK